MKRFLSLPLLAILVLSLMWPSPAGAETWNKLFDTEDEYAFSIYTLDADSVEQQDAVLSYWVRVQEDFKEMDNLPAQQFDNVYLYQSNCQSDEIRVLKNRILSTGELIDYQTDTRYAGKYTQWNSPDGFAPYRKLHDALCGQYYRSSAP